MPFKETVNEKLHLGVLWNLREAVQKERSEIEGGGVVDDCAHIWFLHHNNVYRTQRSRS